MSRIRANQITNQSADGAPTVQNGLVISGVTTSTTFSGSGASLTNIPSAQLTGALPAISGANLTGITQTAINNNANNRIITGSGTANTLEGEANLTFSGATLKVNNASGHSYLKINSSDTNSGVIHFGDQSDDDVCQIWYDNYQLNGLNLRTSENSPITFYTNSTQRLRINSNGHITIGTASAAGGRLYFESTSGAAQYIASGGTNNQDLIVASSAGEKLRISSDGKIGIGDATPSVTLETVGHNQVTFGSMPETIMTYGTTSAYNSGSAGSGIQFGGKYHSNNDYTIFGGVHGVKENTTDGHYAGALLFSTRENGTGSTERMRISSIGAVTAQSQPSFAAYKNTGSYSLNNQVFPFGSVKHNIGSHYNTGNYRFTAPVAGRYLFTFYSILNSTINSGHYEIRVNNSTGSGQSVHFTTVNSSWDHVSSSHLLNLSANDYVTMWSNSNVGWHGGDWQLFCGELLS